MSANSSSFAGLHPPPLHPSNSSFYCFMSKTTTIVFTAYSVANLLLLPLFVLILCMGWQQWKQQRQAISHCDLLTYHSVCMQLKGLVGFAFSLCTVYGHFPNISLVGLSLTSISSIGLTLFHLLTCVERYLAVVHPVTYLGLRRGGGVRVRHISIACVWLLCISWLAVVYWSTADLYTILFISVMGFCFVLITFCSISVLRALRRPGPGETAGNRERADQLKQRAFHTIMAIMGVLMLRLGGNLISNVIYSTGLLHDDDLCVMLFSSFWLDFPSTLALPLLFLHRMGKLLCCRQNTQPG